MYIYQYWTTDKDKSTWWSAENHYDQPENKVFDFTSFILNLIEELYFYFIPCLSLFMWYKNNLVIMGSYMKML